MTEEMTEQMLGLFEEAWYRLSSNEQFGILVAINNLAAARTAYNSAHSFREAIDRRKAANRDIVDAVQALAAAVATVNAERQP